VPDRSVFGGADFFASIKPWKLHQAWGMIAGHVATAVADRRYSCSLLWAGLSGPASGLNLVSRGWKAPPTKASSRLFGKHPRHHQSEHQRRATLPAPANDLDRETLRQALNEPIARYDSGKKAGRGQITERSS
jgi:hypothetical protein